MENGISQIVSNINPSATIEISTKAIQMKREGIDVISFAAGEPDFGTPPEIKNEAKLALDEEFTKYTEVAGIIELRKAIVKKLRRDNNLEYSIDEIIVTNGAKQALYNAFATLLNPNDEILIPSPAYVSFIEQVKLLGAKAVLVPTQEEDSYRLPAKRLENFINDRTKAILINSPNNPTGVVYKKEDLVEIGKLAIENDLWIITDEVYEKICYEKNRHVSIASLDKRFKERCITINGVSKTYSMTGWRVGFAAGPKHVIKAMISFQGHVTGNVNSIAQKAATYALGSVISETEKMVLEYENRRTKVIEVLNGIKNISFFSPEGAFYIFINIKRLLGLKANGKIIKTDLDLATYILQESHVALVPGTAFYYPGYLRISFALEEKLLVEGLYRIKRAIEEIEN